MGLDGKVQRPGGIVAKQTYPIRLSDPSDKVKNLCYEFKKAENGEELVPLSTSGQYKVNQSVYYSAAYGPEGIL